MKNLKNIEKAVIEIASVLAQDEIIKRLLINDTTDALNIAVPDKNLNDLIKDNYISIYPPVENRIEAYGRNTFISILVDNISFLTTDENTRANIVLYVSTNADHLLIKDNRNRLLVLSDRIVQLLDDYKLTASGKINVTSMNHVMLSEFHSSYRINCNIADQQVRKAEI